MDTKLNHKFLVCLFFFKSKLGLLTDNDFIHAFSYTNILLP